ncbi:MAG: helix-turn-helix transcriptional regulator [Saprospiraceae bacterium]|nr:helix-turn-helix transcriptional regulator [Saprospiraceae bacterium]
MQVLEAYKPFEIQEIELARWERRPVKNNFFELVLIKEGSGMQCINYNEYGYEAGSLFLLPPLKCHSFQIEQPSRFVFIKFTSDFFQTQVSDNVNQAEWFREAAYILSNYNQLPGDVIHSALDRQHIYTLVDLILKENRNYGVGSAALIKSFMTSILEVLMRNIKQSSFYEVQKGTDQDERITKLLSYINEHLAEPKLLKVEQLAKTFLLSPTYLSEYFRKKVNVSLREYIIKAKLKLVEIRLLNSNYSLTEIADELSFTDVSHLSKTFKRYTGMSIREFKKQGEYQLLKRSAC